MVHWWVYPLFGAFILGLLTIDLFLFHRNPREPSVKESAVWVAIWVALGLAFAGLVWLWLGPQHTVEYVTAYVVEFALSVDNMFVFAVLFSYFALPARHQHRVLFWGIIGALAFRGLFIAAGAALIGAFHWAIFGFGALLVLTAIRMARSGDHEVDPDKSVVLRGIRRVVPMTADYHGDRFFVRVDGRRLATLLVAVLIAVETTDILFALDSIPAIFGVTSHMFVLFTSNAFAVMGLRSLYFLLAGMMKELKYLKIGLSVILGFVGAKMLVSEWIHIPIVVSLGVIAATLLVSVLASMRGSARTLDAGSHKEATREA